MASRRQTLGKSQRDLAKDLGVAQKSIWEWESGRVAPTLDSIWQIAEALSMTPSELLAVAEEAINEDDD